MKNTKRLEKIRLDSNVKVLEEQEMRLLKGSAQFYCVRLQNGGAGWGTFTTDSFDVASAWSDVWNAHHDWNATCYASYSSPYIYV